MKPHVLVRVDGDVYAHDLGDDLGDDLDAAIAYVIERVAIPDRGSTVHAAIVDASDAGAARLTSPLWWVSVDEQDEDTARDTARALGFDPDDPRIDHVPTLAAALARALVAWESCRTCGGETDDDGRCQQSCERGQS